MKKNNLILVLIALSVADFLGAVDSTSVNIALPKITETLHTSVIVSQWIPNAFTLTLVAFLILAGKIGDKIGAKKLYLSGLLLFGLASLILGFTNITWLLIGFRAIQGIATAILYTMPMIIIAHHWKDREKAFAVTAATFAGGMLVGPVLGGILTNLNLGNFFSWHLIFLINIPFVIFGLIIANKYIPETPAKSSMKLDYWSALILAFSLVILVLAFSIISRYFIILGFLLLVLLYFYQKKTENHLLDFTLFQNQTFAAANVLSFISMVSVIGMSFVLTFYLQDTLHWNPMQSGFALLPVPIITGVFSGIGGQIKNWKLAGFLSSIFIFLGIVYLTQIKPESSYVISILPGLALVSAGAGFLMTTIFAAILGSAPTENSGSASGILNTLQQMGSLIGIALISSMVLQYKLSFTILSICSIIGILSAFFIKNNSSSKSGKLGYR
ncbi:MAG: MFS transporter [Patescibacteria group bacterium]